MEGAFFAAGQGRVDSVWAPYYGVGKPVFFRAGAGGQVFLVSSRVFHKNTFSGKTYCTKLILYPGVNRN